MFKMPKVRVALVLLSPLGVAAAASASPFFNLQVLGSLAQAGPYTSIVAATPGSTVYYEVTGVLSGPGTTNSTSGYTIRATGEIAGTDGVNTIGLDLTNSDTSVLGITSTVDADTGFAAQGPTITANGTDASSTVTGVFAAQSAGTFVAATAPVEIFSGSFLAGSAASDTVSAAYSVSVAAGGLRVATTTKTNQTISLTVANAGPSAADSYVGSTPLVVTTGAVATPEPASLGLLSLGVASLMGRRRRLA